MLVIAACCCAPAAAQAILVLQPGSTASTLAGTGKDGKSVSGAATASPLGLPRGLAYDAAGNLYVADARNHQVTRIDSAGVLTVFAGTGTQGFAGDGGPATVAELNAPGAVAVDGGGNVLIADTGNQRIRRVSAREGTVTTIAGSGLAGFSGDGGPGEAATFRSPSGLATGTDGALYIADTGNHRIRKLSASNIVTTVAGNGSQGDDGDGGIALSASLDAPSGLSLLLNGGLLIADRQTHRLRVLQADGTITAYAVGVSSLRRPVGLASDAGGSVYIADALQQRIVQNSLDGSSTLVGNDEQGAFVSGAPLETALDTPAALASRSNGDLVIADSHNHQLQRFALPSLDFGSVPAGSIGQVQSVTLQNGGADPLLVSAIDLPGGYNRVDSAGGCSAPPLTLKAAGRCQVAVAFAPSFQGVVSGIVQVHIAGGAPQALLVSGIGAANGTLASSSTSLRSDGSIVYAGSPVRLTSTVSGALLAVPTGNVVFVDGPTALATSALSAGIASFSTATLAPGLHTLRATYNGDAAYAASTSAALSLSVVASPDFTMSAGAASYSGKAGGTIVIPITLLPVNGTLNRAVQFTVTGLPAGSQATFAPATLTLGGDTITLTLTLQMPQTLAQNDPSQGPTLSLLAAGVGCGLWLCRRRTLLGLLAVATVCVSMIGCGSGFRGSSTQSGVAATTHTYTSVVTATTTGVLGNSLAHSTSIGLVISQ